jgi:hypothetical protein
MKQPLVGLGIFILVIAVILLALPFVNIPRTESQAYQLTQSIEIVSEAFAVPPSSVTHTVSLNTGDTISIHVTVTSGGNRDIDFYLTDASTTYLSYSRATTINRDWTAPLTRTYNLVYDNSFSWYTSKDVDVHITKSWKETAHRDVTINTPILPFFYVYGGIALLVTGAIFCHFSISTFTCCFTANYEGETEKQENQSLPSMQSRSAC